MRLERVAGKRILVHPRLLPLWRGIGIGARSAHRITQAIAIVSGYGCLLFGLTVMFLEQVLLPLWIVQSLLITFVASSFLSHRLKITSDSLRTAMPLNAETAVTLPMEESLVRSSQMDQSELSGQLLHSVSLSHHEHSELVRSYEEMLVSEADRQAVITNTVN